MNNEMAIFLKKEIALRELKMEAMLQKATLKVLKVGKA